MRDSIMRRFSRVKFLRGAWPTAGRYADESESKSPTAPHGSSLIAEKYMKIDLLPRVK